MGGFVLSCQCFENTSTFSCVLSRPSSMQDRTRGFGIMHFWLH